MTEIPALVGMARVGISVYIDFGGQRVLDYRAWLVAGAILLSVVAGYVIDLRRTRVTMTARSLSSAPHLANGLGAKGHVNKTLHIEGCKEDFVVSPGELVEPLVVPGSSLESARDMYGKGTKRGESGATIWDLDAFTLTRDGEGPGNTAGAVRVSLHQGHVVETLDGVELGIDSFGRILSKMRDRQIEVRQRMLHDGGNWTLIVSIFSACGRKFRSEYSRTILGGADVDRLITPIAAPDGRYGPYRSDVFMNKVVSEYALVASNGSNVAVAGMEAER